MHSGLDGVHDLHDQMTHALPRLNDRLMMPNSNVNDHYRMILTCDYFLYPLDPPMEEGMKRIVMEMQMMMTGERMMMERKKTILVFASFLQSPIGGKIFWFLSLCFANVSIHMSTNDPNLGEESILLTLMTSFPFDNLMGMMERMVK